MDRRLFLVSTTAGFLGVTEHGDKVFSDDVEGTVEPLELADGDVLIVKLPLGVDLSKQEIEDFRAAIGWDDVVFVAHGTEFERLSKA